MRLSRCGRGAEEISLVYVGKFPRSAEVSSRQGNFFGLRGETSAEQGNFPVQTKEISSVAKKSVSHKPHALQKGVCQVVFFPVRVEKWNPMRVMVFNGGSTCLNAELFSVLVFLWFAFFFSFFS